MFRRLLSKIFGTGASHASGADASDAIAMPEPSEHAKGSNQFGFDLYARIRSSAGNLALSPASISAALAMTYGGARGETASQMRAVAHFSGDPETTMTTWGGELRTLTDTSRPMKLRVANRLFGEKSYALEAAYLDRTKSAFDAPLEPVDFKNEPDATRALINRWVEKQTEDRIQDLLPDTSINEETRLVLVNAIYFLADWMEPFDKLFTTQEPFHLTSTTEKTVSTMKRTAHLPVAQVDGMRMVELLYQGGQTAMWIVIADAVDGLAAVEEKLSQTTLASWSKKLATAYVGLELPRFEVNPSESLALKDELIALGMGDAFDRRRADFTAIANPPDPEDRLVIGNVIHKAFVKTDEKGTEAAAATAVEMMRAGSGPPPKPIEFKVDRPFLFFIVDKPSSLVLFMGRVTDPGQTS